MKKIVITLALAAIPTMAFGAGIDLSWDDCVGSTRAALNKNFNCAVTTDYSLQFQYRLPTSVPRFVAVSAFVDYQSATGMPLTPFWHFEAGGCQMIPRSRGIAMYDDITTTPAQCQTLSETWGGDGSAGFEGIAGYGVDFRRPGNGLFVLLDARQDPVPITPSTNYWAFRLNFRTNNASACAGCEDQGILLWQLARFENNDGTPPVTVVNPDKLGNCVTINGAPAANCGAVPTRNTTWGQLKSMYR